MHLLNALIKLVLRENLSLANMKGVNNRESYILLIKHMDKTA